MGKVVEESWDLNSADIVALGTLNDTDGPNRWDGTANKWSNIWAYQVPTGQAHILKPGHHFSCYLNDGSEVGDGTCRIKIVIQDQSQQDEKAIYGPGIYKVSKDFDDVTKMATLGLQSDLAVEEKFWIVVKVYDDGTVNESASYFVLETIRVRSSI